MAKPSSNAAHQSPRSATANNSGTAEYPYKVIPDDWDQFYLSQNQQTEITHPTVEQVVINQIRTNRCINMLRWIWAPIIAGF